MEATKPLESKIAEMHKGLPHLPLGFRAWLTENIWWLAIIGLVLTLIGVLTSLQALSTLNMYSGLAASYGVVYAQSQTVIWVTIAGLIVEAVLLGMAISPLKAKLEKGWRLLFILSLLSIVVSVLSVVLGGGYYASSLVGLVIGTAISWYLLFEIRDGFVKA